MAKHPQVTAGATYERWTLRVKAHTTEIENCLAIPLSLGENKNREVSCTLTGSPPELMLTVLVNNEDTGGMEGLWSLNFRNERGSSGTLVFTKPSSKYISLLPHMIDRWQPKPECVKTLCKSDDPVSPFANEIPWWTCRCNRCLSGWYVSRYQHAVKADASVPYQTVNTIFIPHFDVSLADFSPHQLTNSNTLFSLIFRSLHLVLLKTLFGRRPSSKDYCRAVVEKW